jgi:CRISPR-associated exonuclease Cas4
MEYKEEDFLQLSGIQHYMFCPRQWALIHIENQWKENGLTAEGEWMHKRAHDEGFTEKRGDLIITRGIRLQSHILGVSGQCDILEFHRSDKGIKVLDWPDLWVPYPVEYKHGISKINDCDRAQVCGQALCLEEMLCCSISEGALYYGEPQKREIVLFSEELKSNVREALKQMHALIERGYTPKPRKKSYCHSCSLEDICLPEMDQKVSVNKYIEGNL